MERRQFGFGPGPKHTNNPADSSTSSETSTTSTIHRDGTTTSSTSSAGTAQQPTSSSIEASTTSVPQTSAYSSGSSGSTYSLAPESQPTQSGTALPITQNSHPHNGLSTGSLAAAIVVPILAVFLLLLGAFFYRRRKAQNARNRASSGNSGATFLPMGLKEKWGSLRSSSSSHNAGEMTTNPTNNAYFTGLDTSSHGSRSQRSGENARRSESEAPPPPYVQKPSTARNSAATPLPEVPRIPISFDTTNNNTNNTPAPPPAALNSLHARHFSLQSRHSTLDEPHPNLAVLQPPPRPSSPSARSITSTLYSDTASVHSARAARRSFGPNVIQPKESREEEEEGPFGDEANSPVSPLSQSD